MFKVKDGIGEGRLVTKKYCGKKKEMESENGKNLVLVQGIVATEINVSYYYYLYVTMSYTFIH